MAFSEYLNFTGSGCEDNSDNSFEGRNICQAYCVTKAVQQSSISRSLQTGVSNFKVGILYPNICKGFRFGKNLWQ